MNQSTMTKTNTFSVPKAPLASIVLMILSAYANASDHAVIHNTVLTERLSQSPVHEHNASDSIDIENVLFYLETMKVEVCTSNFNDDKSRASSVERPGPGFYRKYSNMSIHTCTA